VKIYFDVTLSILVTFVELGTIGKKMQMAYFGALRRQTVKKHKTDRSEQGRKRRGKNYGELKFKLRHLIFLEPW